MTSLWTEKYRPQSFADIKGQQPIIEKIEAFVKQKNMPHLLFVGPSGVGKTTTALVIAKQFFGDQWKSNVLELNASDERGIDVVRVKVKEFARTRAIGDYPFKIIYLDESDALTKEAQQALRRTMENYTSTCRFILSANWSSKIIDPIQSRCAVFKFKPLPKEHILDIIQHIVSTEGLTIGEGVADALYEVSGGDVRRLENVMQSCAAVNKSLTSDGVYSLAAVAKPKEIRQVLETALTGDFPQARNLLLDVMLQYGLAGLDIIKQIQKEIWSLELENTKKIKLIDKCGEIEFRMVEGSDEFLQLEALLAQFCAI